MTKLKAVTKKPVLPLILESSMLGINGRVILKENFHVTDMMLRKARWKNLTVIIITSCVWFNRTNAFLSMHLQLALQLPCF